MLSHTPAVKYNVSHGMSSRHAATSGVGTQRRSTSAIPMASGKAVAPLACQRCKYIGTSTATMNTK